MEPWKVLIADPSEDFRAALTRELEGTFQVFTCARGDDALALVRREKPDVLILELALPGLDGIGLLRQLKEKPRILVATDLNTPFVCGALVELGIQYALMKPCPVSTVAERALDLMRIDRSGPLNRSTCQLLEQLGLPSSRQGFQHLLTGLPLLTMDRDQRLGKELYRQIAQLDGVTAGSVEKTIREAIQIGWDNGDPQVWQQFFPGCTRCPKSKEFLFRLADVLRRSA